MVTATLRDPNFFNQDFRASSIGVGFIWVFSIFFPLVIKGIVRPGRDCMNGICWYWRTKGTSHAWNVMTISNTIFFGFLTFFWLLSYIQNRMMQKIYYRFIAWMIPSTWLFAFWSLLAFIIGGVQEGGEVG